MFIITKDTFGIPFIYNIYCDNYDLILKFCHIISDLVKDSVFSFEYLPEGNMSGFKFLNLESNIIKGYNYVLHSPPL